MIQVRTQIDIDAKPDRIWAILTDFDSYPEWNPFIHSIRGELREGARLEVRLSPPEEKGMSMRPRIVRVEQGQAIHWLGRFLLPGLLDGEHMFRIEPLGEDRSRFHHGEDYRGLLVWLFGRFVPDDGGRNYVAMNEALKARAEGRQGGKNDCPGG